MPPKKRITRVRFGDCSRTADPPSMTLPATSPVAPSNISTSVTPSLQILNYDSITEKDSIIGKYLANL